MYTLRIFWTNVKVMSHANIFTDSVCVVVQVAIYSEFSTLCLYRYRYGLYS